MSDDNLLDNGFTGGDKFFGQMIEAGVADEKFIQEIVEMFIAEGQSSLNLLEQGIVDKDVASIQLYAHKLKSSFLMFDMVEAHAIAVELENIDVSNAEAASDLHVALQQNCDLIFVKLQEKYLNL